MRPATRGVNDRELGETLGFLQLLWRVNHGMEQRSRRMQRTLGVTAPQRMVLLLAGRFDGISAGELAALLHVDPGTLSSALRELERRRLLRRAPDAADGRRVCIHLTPAGRALDVDAPFTVERAVRDALRQTGAARRRSAASALERLAIVLEQETDVSPRPRAPSRGSRR
jgi:DNA-binding MarR family transcriptional regulator